MEAKRPAGQASEVSPNKTSELLRRSRRQNQMLKQSNRRLRIYSIIVSVLLLISLILLICLWVNRSSQVEDTPSGESSENTEDSRHTESSGSGNTATDSGALDFSEVGEAPLILAEDFTVEYGSAPAYRGHIRVVDQKDGEYDLYDTAHVKLDCDEVNAAMIGSYPVKVTATDSEGHQSEKTFRLQVVHQSVTQEEVNAYAKNILAGLVRDDMTREQQLRAVFDYVKTGSGMTYISYSDKNNPYYIEGYYALTLHTGDCYTYCAMAQVLLDNLDISYYVVTRVGDRQSDHYWLLVDFGNGFYHFDPSYHILDWHKDTFKLTDREVAEFTEWYNKDCPGWNYYQFDHTLYPATPES